MQRLELGMVTHEVGGAIAPARSALQLLLETDLSSLSTQQQRLLDILQKGLDRAGHVLDNLAAFTYENGCSPISQCHLDLLLEALVDGARLQVKEKNLKVCYTLDASLEPFPVAHLSLEQVLGNLLSNAIKFSRPAGTIEIEIKTGKGAVIPGRMAALAGVFGFQPRYLQVAISNEGLGLSAETRRNLFQPFYRGQEARRTKGTGLGLAVAARLVQRMQGDLRADACDAGARFVLTLPADEATFSLSERIEKLTFTLQNDLERAPHCVAALKQEPEILVDAAELSRACGQASGVVFEVQELSRSSCLVWAALKPRDFVHVLRHGLEILGGESLRQRVLVALRRADRGDNPDALILQTVVRARRTLRASGKRGEVIHGPSIRR